MALGHGSSLNYCLLSLFKSHSPAICTIESLWVALVSSSLCTTLKAWGGSVYSWFFDISLLLHREIKIKNWSGWKKLNRCKIPEHRICARSVFLLTYTRLVAKKPLTVASQHTDYTLVICICFQLEWEAYWWLWFCQSDEKSNIILWVFLVVDNSRFKNVFTFMNVIL